MARRSIRLCGQEIDQPGHICGFFDSREDEYSTLIPYLREGFEAGDHIVNVLDSDRLDDHRARLSAAGIPVDHERVSLASSEETYLAGGSFDMDRMAAFVRDALADAASRGCAVRTAGWMDWIHRKAPGTARVVEYESRMNLLTPDFDCVLMCVFDLSRLDGGTITDIMATHPYVIVRGQIRRNPYYVPPEIYLRELLSAPSRTSEAPPPA